MIKSIEELRESYYEEIKFRYLGLRAALDYNQAAYDADVAESNKNIEKLAKQYYPEYDSEFFHRYHDDHDHSYRSLDGKEKDFYYNCLYAYDDAIGIMGQFAGEWEIRKRHQAVRSEIVDQMRDAAEQATKNFPREFWMGEPWEEELKRWSGDVWGVETP